MRVAMGGQNFHVKGGSDRVLVDEVALLRDKGHDVAPFCASSADDLPTEWAGFFPRKTAGFMNPGLVDVARYLYCLDAKRAVKRFVRAFRPDVFHLHIYYGKLTVSILSEIESVGVPIVQTMHEFKAVCPTYQLLSNGIACEKCTGFRYYNAALNRCNRNSLSRSIVSTVESYLSLWGGSISKIDRFIAVSDFQAGKVAAMGVPRNRITTVHNFVDTGSLEPCFRKGAYFIYFGRLEAVKGVWPLIRAFEELSGERLVIVGDGSERAALERYCEQRRMKNVVFMGFRDRRELGDLVRASIASIVPSIGTETFGLSAAESLSYGKPVIASRIGGLPEVVCDDEDAILVEPGDVAQLKAAVRRLSSSRAMAESMGRTGRANVERKFSRDEHYRKLMAVYRSVS
ncbi:glycosyltransferase family 4 protein [Burkholderia stagnalis]|uniref:glycosyltransferase family 4 protein n=1 Tax=Burkholderia stagnalis TaxID=1503054 RepID=UPI0007C701C3|nr:glycosyltransferase family 4 protein [Burkholderia stagnalis]